MINMNTSSMSSINKSIIPIPVVVVCGSSYHDDDVTIQIVYIVFYQHGYKQRYMMYSWAQVTATSTPWGLALSYQCSQRYIFLFPLIVVTLCYYPLVVPGVPGTRVRVPCRPESLVRLSHYQRFIMNESFFGRYLFINHMNSHNSYVTSKVPSNMLHLQRFSYRFRHFGGSSLTQVSRLQRFWLFEILWVLNVLDMKNIICTKEHQIL